VPVGVPVSGTLRDYAVTHCDHRHQATGGPIWELAFEGKTLVVPVALWIIRVRPRLVPRPDLPEPR
jgi:hypothetical protein